MFQSLYHILDVIENQPGWETQQQFRLILTHWSELVGATVAAHTRPTGINRDVLWVATSSSIWAQELTFKRQLILRKLINKLSFDIKDIRFSPGQWQSRSDDSPTELTNHPSYLPPDINQNLAQPTVNNTDDNFSSSSPNSNKSAVNSRVNSQSWWQQIQARSPHLPLCSQCQCPTPPGEIDRWDCCALCATKKWTR